jgi:hypothetical protein
LMEIDRELAGTTTRDRRRTLIRIAEEIRIRPLREAWAPLIRKRRTARELTNDPTMCHWSLRLSDPTTNHLWSRYLCGIWVPGHPRCPTCPPAPDGNLWPLTRDHLMHCTGAVDVIPPMLERLLALPIVDDLIGPYDRSASDPLDSVLPETAPLLSRLAAVRPDRLEWQCRPGRSHCGTSLEIASALKPLLQEMQARIKNLIPPPASVRRPQVRPAAGERSDPVLLGADSLIRDALDDSPLALPPVNNSPPGRDPGLPQPEPPDAGQRIARSTTASRTQPALHRNPAPTTIARIRERRRPNRVRALGTALITDMFAPRQNPTGDDHPGYRPSGVRPRSPPPATIPDRDRTVIDLLSPPPTSRAQRIWPPPASARCDPARPDSASPDPADSSLSPLAPSRRHRVGFRRRVISDDDSGPPTPPAALHLRRSRRLRHLPAFPPEPD